MSVRRLAFSTALLLVAPACVGNADSSQDDEENVSRVSATLTTVPAGVQCLQITVGSATITRSYPFPNPTKFDMGVPMTGWVGASAQAWNVACSSSMPTPTWIAETQWVVLQPGVPTSINIRMYANVSPSATVDFVSAPIAIAAGDAGSYALMADGSIKVWGQVPWMGNVWSPTTAGTIAGATDIAGGASHVCAIVGNTVKCVGDNSFGQLGNGTNTSAYWYAPATASLPAGLPYTSVHVGSASTCAVRNGNTAYCWGRNDSGQLGDGTTTHRSSPVSWGSYATDFVAAKQVTCGTVADGRYYCRGYLNGSAYGAFTPFNGSYMIMSKTAVSGGTICGIAVDGSTWCYGENRYGELANGTITTGVALGKIESLTKLKAIAGAYSTFCAIREDDTVVCWGRNDKGQLGIGNTDQWRVSPVPVLGLNGVTRLVAGYAHFCALKNDGTVWCWGDNNNGQIGDGTFMTKFAPTRVNL
ncbi:MAG: hypothetical protein HYV09_22425 [Deltaproteobacteria bacterium]|nr:hypothetical protein [Deltaproteobacteria bacterium]